MAAAASRVKLSVVVRNEPLVQHMWPGTGTNVVEALPGEQYSILVVNQTNRLLYVSPFVDESEISAGSWELKANSSRVFDTFQQTVKQEDGSVLREKAALQFATPELSEGPAGSATDVSAYGQIKLYVYESKSCLNCPGWHSVPLGGTKARSKPKVPETKKSALGIMCSAAGAAAGSGTEQSTYSCPGYTIQSGIVEEVKLRYMSRAGMILNGIIAAPAPLAAAAPLVCDLTGDEPEWDDGSRKRKAGDARQAKRIKKEGEDDEMLVCDLESGSAPTWGSVKVKREKVELE